MPREKRKRIEAEPSPHDQGDETGYPPSEYSNHFACPFVKHNGDRYKAVNNACTSRWGFRNIGTLNEHIQRVHSLQFGCLKCKKRFTRGNKTSIEQEKREHRCIPRQWASEDPEWMDKERESRFTNWNEQGHTQESGAEKWSRIFKCLFPNEEHVPDPFYDYLIPKHLKSQPPAVTQELPKHENGYLEAIDPSLIFRQQNPFWDTSNLGSLDTPERPQLDPNALERNESQFGCGFEYSVSRGMDSGYDSWANPQEPQGPGALFLNEPPPYIPSSSTASDHGHGNLFGINDRSTEADKREIDVLLGEDEG